MAAELRIPEEHQQRFIDWVSLPSEIKEKIYIGLNNAGESLNNKDLTNVLHYHVKELSKEQVNGIVQIYLNLLRARNNFEVSIDDFLPILSEGLINTGIDAIAPTEEIINDFKNLINSGVSISNRFKVIDNITENNFTYLESKIYQDIRPIFDNDGKIIASGIINKLKIIFRNEREVKDIFFSLDVSDLTKLMNEIKKSQENIKEINSIFEKANIIE